MLLQGLGTLAPACTLLRAKSWPYVRQLLEGQVLIYPSYLAIKDVSAGVAALVKQYVGVTIPNDHILLLKALLGMAVGCGVRSTSGNVGAPRKTEVAGVPMGPSERDPMSWSEEEAFLRTGVFSGMDASEPWMPSSLGGGDVRRCVGVYTADKRMSGEGGICTKHKLGHQRLTPGLLVGWCLDCGICLGFTVMANAESPRTVFEWVFTRCTLPPEIICYDNGCNLQRFCLSREPGFFGKVDFYVDHLHFMDHNRCSLEYCSANCPDIRNSSLAEQKNSILRSLETHAGYMRQEVFLWYARYFLHRMNVVQRSVNAGTCWHVKNKSKK
jgi:hypothetical protein